MREKIIQAVEEKAPVYQALALDIHAHPEVSNYEFHACEVLSKQLAAEDFEVTVDVAGHRTGFTACYKSAKPGPVIVFLAEYDALAGLGHGCGHNLYGATSCLAGAALRPLMDELGGELRVYGTPGEEGGENGSAKGSFVREGFLKDVDAAMGIHSGSQPWHGLSRPNLGCAPVDIEFWGRSAHAAAAPEQGINALDALILTFNGINALRQQLTDDVRIHGIVVDGGKAPNSIPDYAHGKFYLRADNAPGLEAVYQKVEAIVQAAAAMTGAKGRMRPYQNRVENMLVTPSLDAVYAEALRSLGVTDIRQETGVEMGSSDVGNISQVVPTIQPFIPICDHPIPGHSEAFRDAACSEMGLQSIVLGAKAMALTAFTLYTDPERLKAIRADHAERVKAQ